MPAACRLSIERVLLIAPIPFQINAYDTIKYNTNIRGHHRHNSYHKYHEIVMINLTYI